MKLVLVSPMPPMKTGTANYLKLLIRDISAAGVKSLTVVYDRAGLTEAQRSVSLIEKTKKTLRGNADIEIDLREKGFFYEEDDQVVVYFTANNHFHFYVYDLLLKPKRASRLLVIHEPSCMMAATAYFEWDRVCSRHDYIDHLSAQFGRESRHMRDDIYNGRVVESLQYEILGFDYRRFLADKVFVHSRFARAKLLLELDDACLMDIMVTSHPDEDPIDVSTFKTETERLHFGIFGFVNPAKRVYEVMAAFAKFIAEIGEADAKRRDVQLIIVGQLPPTFYYSPKARAKKLGIIKFCRFYGYVDKAEFNELYSSCALIFNLRFPSCGETTGLAGYGGMGPKLVMSNYHAFRELPADFLVSLDNEEAEICDLMLKAYKKEESGNAKQKNSKPLSAGTAIAHWFIKNV